MRYGLRQLRVAEAAATLFACHTVAVISADASLCKCSRARKERQSLRFLLVATNGTGIRQEGPV
jgi:hypothetical protein